MLDLALVDYLILLGYAGFLISIAWTTRHESRGDEVSYLVAGRRLTLPAFVATLVSTWYGGILGVGEYSFRFGISNWFVFGVPYYLAALLFALFIAKRARRTRLLSIPDQLEHAYGRGPALIGAGVVFVLTVPAAYVLMVGTLLQAVFGGSLLIWIVIGTLFSTLYVAAGGFRSVVRTDHLQFVLMYLGFGVLLGTAVHTFGGFGWLEANLPEQHLAWDGGLPLATILVWYVIALQTLVDPGFFQRVYAAKDERIARGGIFVSLAFWMVFDFLTTFSGLYARAALGPDANPLLSYPLLADQLLPAGVKGLFLLALLAVIMSTVDSFSFLAAQTLGRDIVARRLNLLQDWKARRVQLALLVSALLAVLIAAWKGSAVAIWYELGSVGIPMLLPPLAGSFRTPPLFRQPWVGRAMIGAGLASGIWAFFGNYGTSYPLGLEPIFAGLAVSIILLIPGLQRRRAKG